jgi:basic membrane lipoprotein Med (substrate-binding protein (PBP1-ABC) superfamily)
MLCKDISPTFGLAIHGVGYARDNPNMPPDVWSIADTFTQQIIAGQLTPPDTL